MNNYYESDLDIGNPLSLMIQLKEAYAILNEREEELELWREKQSQYAEALSELSILRKACSSAEKQIEDLEQKISFLIMREQVLIGEFTEKGNYEALYDDLYKKHQSALLQISMLESQLSKAEVKNKLLTAQLNKKVEEEQMI